MKITLPDQLAKIVRSMLAGGVYADESDVIRAALRSLRREESSRDHGLTLIRRDLADAAVQLDRGAGREFDAAATKRRVRASAERMRAMAARPLRTSVAQRSQTRKKSA